VEKLPKEIIYLQEKNKSNESIPKPNVSQTEIITTITNSPEKSLNKTENVNKEIPKPLPLNESLPTASILKISQPISSPIIGSKSSILLSQSITASPTSTQSKVPIKFEKAQADLGGISDILLKKLITANKLEVKNTRVGERITVESIEQFISENGHYEYLVPKEQVLGILATGFPQPQEKLTSLNFEIKTVNKIEFIMIEDLINYLKQNCISINDALKEWNITLEEVPDEVKLKIFRFQDDSFILLPCFEQATNFIFG